ncbi:MAG: DNA repair exonuclease [Candidatus Hydrogenedentota bacterium]|nr:MAG: DNA repair exonuclease [Candidatus Hydrogenedentota bacterium]
MSVRLMHLADLHLGAPQSYLDDKAEQRAQDLESALFRALALAPEKDVHATVIAGDLFDSFSPPPDLVARVKAAFRKTTEDGIPIILIPGTHDSHRYARCVYTREEFPGVDILLEAGKPIFKNLNGHAVYLYGFCGGRNQDSPPFRRGAGEGLHVALAHGSVSEAAHWSPSPRDFSLRPGELETSGFNYVALGHHHNFQEFRCDKVSALYPGTLEGLKFGENGDRHLIIAGIGENGSTLEKLKHNRRTVSEIRIDLSLHDIGCDEELAAFIERHADPDGIIKVLLSGTTNFLPARREIEARFAERFFHFEIADETSIYSSEMVRSAMNENTVRGIFMRNMLKKIEQGSGEERAAAELALRLGVEQFMRLTDENLQTFD